MMQFRQSIFGWMNRQSVTVVQQRACIDILPSDIDDMLSYVIEQDTNEDGCLMLVEPDLDAKNPLNGIDKDKYQKIRSDFIHFAAIDKAMKSDTSRDMKRKYQIAARILNEQYFAGFKGDFPSFAIQVVSRFSQIKGDAGEDAVKLFILINYMYSECDVGVVP